MNIIDTIIEATIIHCSTGNPHNCNTVGDVAAVTFKLSGICCNMIINQQCRVYAPSHRQFQKLDHELLRCCSATQLPLFQQQQL